MEFNIQKPAWYVDLEKMKEGWGNGSDGVEEGMGLSEVWKERVHLGWKNGMNECAKNRVYVSS